MKKILFLCVITIVLTTSLRKSHQTEGKIKWMTWEQMQAAQQTQPRNVLVDVYTDWCGWCKKMDATTFSHPEIVKYVNENYYAVKFNAEQRTPVIFNGKEYRFVSQGNRGYHELAAYIMNNRMSYPTTVYLDERLNLLSPVPGYLEPAIFETILYYFATNAFLNTPWEQFQKEFKGKI
jgi:thioredoxin-related protein